jgi:predicted amidohydrolase YtcJ
VISQAHAALPHSRCAAGRQVVPAHLDAATINVNGGSRSPAEYFLLEGGPQGTPDSEDIAMKLKRFLTLVAAAAVTSVAIGSALAAGTEADTIYAGGPIVTINDAAPSAEALAVRDGRIIAVGTKADVLRTWGAATRLVDLGGRTMVPGFVDGHSHFTAVGFQTVAANLMSPPDGPVRNIPGLQSVLRAYIAVSPLVRAHGVVIGMNYDDSQLVEHRHPTRQELDAVSTELPIMVTHQSGHFGVLNSAALQKVGLTAQSADPAGGVIRREADGRTPNGVVEEVAFFQAVGKMLPAFTAEEAIAQLKASEAIYLANGFTTIQEGKTSSVSLKLLAAVAAKGGFKADIVSYPDLVELGDAPVLHGPLMSRAYTNHFRIGGVKLTLDGSPQGKTAWFTVPYFKVPDGQKPDYRGYPAFTDARLDEWVSLAYRNHWQLLAHAIGDAAIDQLIRAVRTAQAAYPGDDRRTVLVHGHFIREDQVPQIKALGIFNSTFPLHTFNWGDYHRTSVVGPERAENVAPTGWLLRNHMMFSIHSDAPVIFPNSMQLIATAVNRTTRSGYVLGPQHRLTPLQALHAMTLWPAYQHFEENTKGSLEVGKLADLVILDRNPLTADPRTLRDIKVVETIKEGKTVYADVAKPTP